ncbi:MAG: hypothetical protein HY961_08155 [Ignavibacteriae bacterium]|nr:hypothetical protein [Ignavibacteriota bacterium]
MKRRILIQIAASVLLSCPLFGQTEPARTMAADSEQRAWADVNSLDRSSLKIFLARFPSGKFAGSAKLAMKLQEMMSRLGRRESGFIIPLNILGEKWNLWRSVNPQKGAIGYFAKSVSVVIDDNVRQDSEYGCFSPEPLSGGQTRGLKDFPPDEMGLLACPTGDGSIIAIQTNGLTFPFTRSDLLVESASDEPIYFGVIKGKGLAYLTGVGTVVLPDGKSVTLGERSVP